MSIHVYSSSGETPLAIDGCIYNENTGFSLLGGSGVNNGPINRLDWKNTSHIFLEIDISNIDFSGNMLKTELVLLSYQNPGTEFSIYQTDQYDFQSMITTNVIYELNKTQSPLCTYQTLNENNVQEEIRFDLSEHLKNCLNSGKSKINLRISNNSINYISTADPVHNNGFIIFISAIVNDCFDFSSIDNKNTSIVNVIDGSLIHEYRDEIAQIYIKNDNSMSESNMTTGFHYHVKQSFIYSIAITDALGKSSVYRAMNSNEAKDIYGFEDDRTEFLFYLNTEDMSFINFDASIDGTLVTYYTDGTTLELFTNNYDLTSLEEGVILRTKKVSNSGTYINLDWTNPNIVLVTNERNESIKLHFTGDRLIKIENTDFSRKTEFNYITANGKYYLSYASDYLCDELGDRLVRKDSFDYYSSSMYLESYSCSINSNRIYYSYENQKLKKIIVDNGLSSSMEYTYFPNENYTKLVNQYNEEFFVYYNDSQQKVMTLSSDGYVSYESQANYNGIYVKQRKAVLSSDLNLIENIDLSTWEGYSPSEDSKNENGIFPDAMGDYIFKRKGYKEQPRLIKTTITPSVIYEGEQWFFSVWGKQKFSLSSIFQVIVSLNDQNGVIKDYTFNFNKTESNWQLLSGYIIADVEYKSITLAIKNQGDEEVYIGKTKLYKNCQSSEYGYNNKGQIEDLSLGSNHVEFTYDNGKIKTASTPSGRLINYTYNNDGYLESIEDDCSLYSIKNIYNNKNLVKQVISSIDGKVIEKSYIYNARGEVTKTVDENGLITDYLYDNFGRLLEIQDSSGIVYNNKYNTRGKIIRSKNHLNDSCDGGVFTYGANKELYSVETENKIKYGFSYNYDRLITGVSINDSSIISESFEKLINNQKTDLTTEKKYRVNPEHHFQFNYDDKSRLISKKNNQNDIVSIVYDDVNHNIAIEDHVNHNTKTTKFNDNGTIKEKAVNIGNTRFSNYQYRYDNLNGLQKKNYFEYSSSYLSRSYDFDQIYEFQEYSLEGYLDRISIPFLNDYVRPNKTGRSLYSDVPSLKLFTIDYDENLKQSIMKFVDNASCLSFNKNDINANRIHMKKYGNNIYDQTVWKSNFSVNKLMYSWMRLSGQTDLNKEIMRFGDLSLYVNSNKVLILQHGTSHISTGLSIFLNEWSLVGLRLAGTEATVFINGDSSTHVVSYNSSNVDYLTIGKHPATNHQSYLDEITPSLASCVMDILYIGFGSHHTTTDHLSSMYFEGKNYLDVEFKNTKEQVSYYNHYIYKDAEVISLNGSFTTSKSNEPISYFYTNKDFKLDKTRLFEYDHDLQRHVYGSYRNYSNFDVSKKSKLVYQLGYASVGSVNLFVKPSIAFGYNKRTILNFKNGTNSVLDISMDEQNELKILVNEIPYSTNGLKLTINEWQMLTVLWQTNQIQISVNNSALLVINTTTFNLENTTLYIGSSYTNDIPDNHFEGAIQMLSIWHNNLTAQSIHNLFDDGLAMIHQTEFDVNGRLKSKNLIDGEDILSKKYQYYDEVYDDNGEQKQKLNSLPTSEIDIDGIETVYVYDEYSNVLSKEKIGVSGDPFQITRYDYDVLKRLSQESVSTVTIDESNPNNPIRSEELLYAYHYSYDSNGNITEKKKVDSNNQVDYVDTYHYSTSFKDRLENISRNDHGVTTMVYGMTYSSDEPFRPSTITENGQTKNLVWHGPKLMQYGDYEYAYNEIGLRIKKTAPGLNLAYDVDDFMIIRSIDKIYDRIIDYHFDQHEQVIGFSYQGKEFLYQRDILGEIYGIIDKNGKRFVTYKYTAYGVPTIEIPNDLTAAELSLAQAIRDLNIYLYKGYVYDQETGLYYCHTRYYNPNIGRWISIDDVSYLDPESIGGMNLYAYCGNNPVMRVDYYGHFWDTILDIISIGWSLSDFLENPTLGNFGWLALDVAFALIPFIPSVSKLVKGASHIDEVADVAHGFSKIDDIQDAIVIGNKMSRVEDVARIQDALTYAGYIPLNLLGDSAPVWIKTLARIDNAKWLINHVYDGYRILDIGKDSRTYWAMVKSAYGMEKRILFYLRNIKKIRHIGQAISRGIRFFLL